MREAYRCPFCGAEFESFWSCLEHIEEYHGESVEDDPLWEECMDALHAGETYPLIEAGYVEVVLREEE